MANKKKKYNARFPPARIKKIMQKDEEVGKVAAPVPVIISRALELFVESLVTRASEITRSRSAKTLSTSHLKACILADERLCFLKELVSSVPDVQGDEEPYEVPPVRPKLTGVRKLRAKNGSIDVAGPSHSTAEETDSAEDEEDDYLEEETDDGSSENTAEAVYPSLYPGVRKTAYLQPPTFPPNIPHLPQYPGNLMAGSATKSMASSMANIMASSSAVATAATAVNPDDDYDS
ncbi:negative cofactor 2 alpha isoform X2 [Rhipicephalus microplus]|uniref:Dr1-associated corepressor n=1 Tax=Rhipicephalus microplus TaxID=6941 RepID=A0A6M2CUY8_RHIMP|nr:dr1-associated corepressor-like isoform X1 [Rhipicephalus microplus]